MDKKKINLKNEKIKYVALGDSISEGFNAKFNYGFAGKMNIDGTIIGTSWPSYVARFFQKINKSCLESFENFAMSGSRPEDWNYFLGVEKEKYNYENSSKKVEFSKMVNEINDNPERNRLKRQFGNFGKEKKSDFDYLIKSIKNANIITINIGANYLIPLFPINDIVNWIISNNLSNKEIMKKLDDIIFSLEESLLDLFNRIKELNPEAWIYAISYNRMFGPFWETISDFFRNLKINDDIVDYCCGLTNEVISNCAKKSGIFFISTNNKKFWKENNYYLSNVFYEIHPTIYGYKKMAQDIFIKMTLPEDFWKNSKNVESLIPSFNKEYLNLDKNQFDNCIDFNDQNLDDKKIINKIFGKNDDYLFKETSVEEESKFLEKDLFFEQYLHRNNDPHQLVWSSTQKSIFTILSIAGLEVNDQIKNDINDFFKLGLDEVFLIKNNFISILVNKIQKKIDDYFITSDIGELPKSEFYKICFSEIFDPDFSFQLMKKFAIYWTKTNKKAPNYQNFLKVFKNIISRKNINTFIFNIISNWITNVFKIHFNIPIKKNEIKNIFEFIISKFDFYEFTNILVDFYFRNIEKIQSAKKLETIIDNLFKDTKVNNFIYESIKIIFNTFEITEHFVEMIMDKLNILKTSNNLKIIKRFITDFFGFLSENRILIEILSSALSIFLTKKNDDEFSQKIIDYVFEQDKKNFWSKLGKIDFSKISESSFENYVYASELILSNMNENSFIFKFILNLNNPKNYLSENNKIRPLSLIKYFDKALCLKKPLSQIFKRLIDKYYLSKFKNEENIYYKNFFRLMLILIFMLRQLFQKNLQKNIFMNKKNSIVWLIFFIAGYRNGKNKGIDNFILNIFNEKNNYNLEINYNITANKKSRPLVIIYNFDKDEKMKKTKEKKILDFIKDGFIE